ncbi:HypC/HybG/HupF family hydrogenase formation chaperone [Motiliproteus sediminis]|uniref:HypC/HybG/HupF family hydrogenase formation chaperone n=1 Tax=Motiliproteus sediminis TaxID=1468178 RepID=UPI001AEFFE39|nr:HypC/HybG/HupF family hydrogenase formation chaperone [Motiliproteus sediminis]
MCIGVPSQVIALDGMTATVESLGQQRVVSLLLMAEEVALGDYLLIQVGDFAVEKIEPQRALDALEYLKEVSGLLPENAAAAP